MSKVSEDDKDRLRWAIGDDESYHLRFDDILEEKLTELDPEWMEEMSALYEASDMSRWCA